METELMPRRSVIAMITEVEAAKDEVKQAFGLLASAKKRLKTTLGNYHDLLWQDRLYDNDLEHEAESSQALIERNAWKSVVARLQVQELVSVKKREELDRQLDKEELPPLTEHNVITFMRNLYEDMDSLLEDSAREVFDWLRPTHNWRQLKTNEKNVFGLGNKVIVEGGMNDSYGGGMPSRTNYYMDKYFKALDNVFHLLDGQGVAKYPNDFCTLISQAAQNKESECSTPYFRLKWFKNRNLHIEFLRMDLVTKLNQLAGSDKLAS